MTNQTPQTTENKPAKFKTFLNKGFRNCLVFILVLLLTVNIVTFTYTFTTRAASGVNVLAKAYMSAATTVTFIYVIPLSQIFGMDNPIEKPFENFRDYLFDKGVEKIPKDDAEKYVWWFCIKFPQYETIVAPQINAFSKDVDDKINKFPEEKIPKLYYWTDQIYNIFEPFAKLKIKDPEFREKRLNMFNAMAVSYHSDRYILVASYYTKKTGKHLGFYYNINEVNKYKKLFYQYRDLYNYSKKYEKDSYDYFFNKTRRHMYHYMLNMKLGREVLDSKLYNNQKINCNDDFLNAYGYNYDILDTEYRQIPMSNVDANNLMWALFRDYKTFKKIFTMCPNNPNLKFMKKYIDKEEKLDELWLKEQSDKEKLNGNNK